jgi:cytochrome c peroxidase
MIPPVAESGLAMGGNRARIAARIYDHYRAEYSAIFGDPQIFGACRAIIPPDGLPGRMSGCQSDADGPWNDAFDCIDTCTEAQVDGEAVRRAITEMLVNYAKAIAAYEHELVTKSSRFDRFMLEGGRLEASEIRGARLFAGKAACIDCHHTPLFSDDRYYNTGVPEVGTAIPTEADCPEGHPVCDCTKGQNCLPFGYYDGLTKLKNSKYHRTGTWSDDPSDDSRAELYALAPTEEMKGAWRTPTLRDVALTAPYMHNGSLATLEEVIDFYDAGGSSLGTQPAYKSVKMQPLGLSVEEKADLAAFLRALTSDPLSEELISAPAVPPLD